MVLTEPFQENHQALASDVHIVEESLEMVDDCLNLLDKSKISVCLFLQVCFSSAGLLSLKRTFGESQ